MFDLIRQIFKFARVHRKLWIVPPILLLLLIGGSIVLLQTTAIAPFFYALF